MLFWNSDIYISCYLQWRNSADSTEKWKFYFDYYEKNCTFAKKL